MDAYLGSPLVAGCTDELDQQSSLAPYNKQRKPAYEMATRERVVRLLAMQTQRKSAPKPNKE
jgi:hypothetical protein